MCEEKIYIVYRVYSKEERTSEYDVKARFYGWSLNKNVIKAFTSQRSKSKYKVIKTYIEFDNMQFDGIDLDSDNMIDFIKLRSAKTHEEFHLFMTANEMKEAEIRIQVYFRDLCYISDINGKCDYVKMFLSLKDHYRDALDYIGYRPPELSAMFDSADYRDDPGDIMGITELIEEAYSGSSISPSESYDRNNNPPGLSVLSDIAIRILYSVESFVKVLRDDL